jgi:hypothetical protein
MKKIFIVLLSVILFCFLVGGASKLNAISKNVSFDVIDGGGLVADTKDFVSSNSILSAVAPTVNNDLVGYSIEATYNLYRYSTIQYGVPVKKIMHHEFGASNEQFTYTISDSNSITYSISKTLSISLGAKISKKISAKVTLFDLVDIGSEIGGEFSTQITNSISTSVAETNSHGESLTITTSGLNNKIVLFYYTVSSAYKYVVEMQYKIYKYTRTNNKSKSEWSNPLLVNSETESKTYFYAVGHSSATIGTSSMYFSNYSSLEEFLNFYNVTE